MAEEKFGIENLKKVIAFGVKVGTDISTSLEDGKISLTEAFALLPDFLALPDLLANKQAIIDEAKDLSMDEVNELVSGFGGVVKSEDVINTITDALNIIVSAKNLIERFTAKKDTPEVPPTT